MLVLLALATSALQRDQVDLLLQSAAHKEMVEGDFEQAIRIYRDIISRTGVDRSVAAKALVRMGLCYEKLGNQRAQGIYERVVLEFADQAEAVRQARARLAKLRSGDRNDRPASPTYRLILNDLFAERHFAPSSPFDLSPDGAHVVFLKRVQDQGRWKRRIHVSDLTGTLVHPLLAEEGTWWGFRSPRWSPDNRYIAYVVHKAPYDSPGDWAIFVVDPQSGAARQVGPNFPDNAPPLHGICWNPDSRAITYLLNDGIYILRLETGETTRIQPMNVPETMALFGYSPDGRWLAFQNVREEDQDQNELDIWILPAAGGRALRLTDVAGADAHPAWSLDGRAIYFVSTRTGDANIWKLNLNPVSGLPQGEPQQVTFFTDARITFPKMVAGGGQVAFMLQRANSAIQVAQMSHPEKAKTVARGFSPVLSPDGTTIYFVGQGPEQTGIFEISSKEGPARRITESRPCCGFDLSPDGQHLAYQASEGNGISLYVVPTTGAKPRLLAKSSTFEGRAVYALPRWSPDGSEILYVQESTLFKIRAEGGQPKKLAQLYRWQEFLWSPDGEKIGALGYPKPGEDIAAFVIPASGGEPMRVTRPEEVGYKEGLTWHPDSLRMAYVMYVGPGERSSEIKIAYADGKPTARFIKQPEHWDYVGRWSPDGRYFFFLSTTVKPYPGFDLYRHDPDSGMTTGFAENVNIGLSGLAQGLLSWSRSGEQVTWTTAEGSVRQLWLMEDFR